MSARDATDPAAGSSPPVRERLRTLASALAVIVVAMLLASPASAEESGTEETKSRADGWSFQFVPYVWLPELQGSLQVRKIKAPIDVGFGRLFDLLGNGDLFAGGGHFEAQYQRLSLFIDAFGGTARPTEHRRIGKIDLTLNFTYDEFGTAFTLLDLPAAWVRRPILLDAVAGARLMYFYSAVSIAGDAGRVMLSDNATLIWADPFVGGRWSIPIVGDLSGFFRGDIGGFGAGSQLAWNLIGGFQYDLSWKPGSASTSFILGYKALAFDYQTGSGNRRKAVNLVEQGPLIGLSFRF